MRIKVCTGPACTRNFSTYTLERAEAEASKRSYITVETCNCQGNCQNAPTVLIDQTRYNRVNGVELKKILAKKKS